MVHCYFFFHRCPFELYCSVYITKFVSQFSFDKEKKLKAKKHTHENEAQGENNKYKKTNQMYITNQSYRIQVCKLKSKQNSPSMKKRDTKREKK